MNKQLLGGIGAVALAGTALATYQAFGPEYADVVRAEAIVVKEPIVAEVIATTPITEPVTESRNVCEDKVVERRAPERFGNRDGAVVGALVGGLIGSRVGDGDGRTAATVAGAVAGGYAGREIDRRHVGGRTYTETVSECRVATETRDRVMGYEVVYVLDGERGTTRVDRRPGDTVTLGERDRIVGYDVTWTYDGAVGTVQTVSKPGDTLRIEDGIVQVADPLPVDVSRG